MIVSHLWLTARRWTGDPVERFVALVTNLEPMPLRFRFQFVVTPCVAASVTLILRNTVGVEVSPGPAAARSTTPWAASGGFLSATADLLIAPGATANAGLERRTTPCLSSTATRRSCSGPTASLRGHLALTLPALPSLSASVLRGPSTAQLDRPARVMVSAIRRRSGRPGAADTPQDDVAAMPLLGGKGEVFVAPEPGTRVAAKRAARRRR